ncbi:GTPase obg [[Clostridium] cellulosi]|uniref:GTPase Obg n=1 Tax=[Clostridium] cellulosi TaxID=29343 RepID=A0A078KRF3_9FIRM|nr:GTPase obg [[Clostridium] cellulosi]
MFVDIAKIYLKAGNGGNGCVSFHREKYVAAGGPDGGDGGNGGDIVFEVNDNLSTLADFRYKRKYVAPNGENGKPNRSYGKSGKNLVIKVPRGTIIRDAETGAILADMSSGEPFVAAKGGRGGWGNMHFATPTRQVPNFAKAGKPGDELEVILELKLLADVGLVGFPNVGKSTLLSVVSEATPKIGNYHFTTLSPALGVVRLSEGESFVMADIPGLIEGASEGAGLGHEFLRHIDRCRLLIHVVDVSGSEARDPIEDYETICKELVAYDPQLVKRPQIVAGNKADIATEEQIERFRRYIEGKGLKFFPISAASHKGVDDLINEVRKMLSKLPPIKTYEPEVTPESLEKHTDGHEINIEVRNGVYYVTGEWLKEVINSVNFQDYDSLHYFEKVLKNSGVYTKLEEAGIQEGDTVNIYDMEFDYVK